MHLDYRLDPGGLLLNRQDLQLGWPNLQYVKLHRRLLYIRYRTIQLSLRLHFRYILPIGFENYCKKLRCCCCCKLLRFLVGSSYEKPEFEPKDFRQDRDG